VGTVRAAANARTASLPGRTRAMCGGCRFNDGRELMVEPSDDFEAWGLTGPKNVKAVCRPRGGVSTWGAAL
jgi:hypothetical protein